jgi:hypothetical protein
MSTVPSGTRFIGISENVNLTERKSAVLNAETQPYTIEDLAATVGVGSEGPQGVQGPAGPPGPVGPAGLEWQGTWNKNTSYVENDAVGFSGASYFCILDIPGSALNQNPNNDPTHWALLASQGAIGPQGVQGPTGPQGPSGGAGTLQQTVDNGNTVTTGDTKAILTGNSLSILTLTTSIGNKLLRDSLRFQRDNGSGTINRIDLSPPTNIVNNRTITLPDADGTVALQTYKIWRASVKQTSGGPSIVTVFENTLGGSVTIASDTFGSGFTLNTSALFTNLKTFAPSTTYHANNLVFSLYPTVNSTSQITYATKKTSDNGDSVPYSNNLIYIEVIVYN